MRSGAAHLFDGMPERLKNAGSGEDRISALPDVLLLHTLSLLPSDEAVRTCVLARRWKNLWRYTPGLRLVHGLINDTESRFRSAEHFNKFASHLIVLRDRSPLVNCEIILYQGGPQPCPYVQAVQLWIQYALACQVKVLHVRDYYGDQRLLLNVPFISRHLMALHLQSVILEGSVDFSSCLVLEDLEMHYCDIYMWKISSKLLKRLCITGCFFLGRPRTRISAPGLISLQIDDCDSRTPLLESMPLLETAFIRVSQCDDVCDNDSDVNCGKQSCDGCRGLGGYQSVLLNGLSNAVSLELIAEHHTYIFRRDVAWCPIFGRLKTLLLNECCAVNDLQPLVRVLERSPVLEKLTLQLFNHMDVVSSIRMEGNHAPIEQSFICAHLKVANIECLELDEMVRKIWNILRTCGVHPEKISIKTKQPGLRRFTIEKLPR